MPLPTPLAYTTITIPLGQVLLAVSEKGLCGVWFEGQRHYPDTQGWPSNPDHPVLQQAIVELQEYFSGRRMSFTVPLDLHNGTALQQTVWRALLGIGPGRTTTYAQLSSQIRKPTALRAVANAIGRNPISIIVPCHRVLGTNGSLTGYAGGLERKEALLRREGVITQQQF